MRAQRLATWIVVAGMGIGESAAGGHALPGEDRLANRRDVPEGEHRVWGELIVRTPLSRDHLDVLTSQVDRIWAPYGVTLDWHDVPPPSFVPDGFSGWVRILIERNASDRVKAGTRREPAIAALHMPGGVPRNVIYVSLDGARTLLRQGSSGKLPPALQDQLVARIAGRAIAHELGHYLFQTTGHAEEGLMRAEFTPADLLDSGLTRFRLTPIEAARLVERLFLERQGLLARDRAGGAGGQRQ